MARSLPHRKKLKDVENIIVVASGKGGVGKTTTAVNLAISLSLEGKRLVVAFSISYKWINIKLDSVGILDGDIFGPTVPLMMNIKETPLTDENNMIIPPVNFGVKCLSMGLLLEDSSAVIWRGPLVMSALQRLLKGATWVSDLIIFLWKSNNNSGSRDHLTFLSLTHHLEPAMFIFPYHRTSQSRASFSSVLLRLRL